VKEKDANNQQGKKEEAAWEDDASTTDADGAKVDEQKLDSIDDDEPGTNPGLEENGGGTSLDRTTPPPIPPGKK
jgi:hypothetical protein